jgi:hypothetical protein
MARRIGDRRNDVQTLQYPYKPKPWVVLLAAAFFGAIALFMSQEALTNDRGLILNGLIELSVRGATIFYWCIAAIGAAFVAIAVPMFIVGLVSKTVLTVTATDLAAPRSAFSKRATVIRLADIKQIVVQTVQKQRFMKVHHSGGNLSIAQSMLPSAAAFDEIHAALHARSRGARAT